MFHVEVALADILGELDGIAGAAFWKSLEDYRREWLLKRGIERGIEIISEAQPNCRNPGLRYRGKR